MRARGDVAARHDSGSRPAALLRQRGRTLGASRFDAFRSTPGRHLTPTTSAPSILDPHANTREAQLAAIDTLFGHPVTLIDLAPVYGNCLAASTPLAINVTHAAATAGRWPHEAVLRGDDAFCSGRPVLINACGLMSGCAALVVQAHVPV